ncbi:MAG: chromosome segregation protein SMC [Clostridiaceae bacterium]|nr:chromosome segregation protein SMC [Clostridiaceae bacterium]
MHLKRLHIQGFKSFAEKTKIEFKKGITGIVGPNGSGKSNVSDAIRWVLGEQSIKTLRGNKMEDVIFSGTDKRKPLGYAEVSIVFDNKDETIPIEYSEVSVTRRMFRSGESEYYINKNACRLKDIKELFMDTGVGKDGYSIIGQGRVDEILSTKSEDRRHIFEEAAGIVKYKTRKEESEKKLKKTEENLVRINDIVFELERQVNPLENQAVKARSYLEIAQRLKKLEVNFYIREIDRLKEELISIEKERKKINNNIEESLSIKETIETKYFSIKNKIENINNSIEELQEKKYSIQNNIEKKDNEFAICNEKERFSLEERDRLNREKENFLKEKEKLLIEKEKMEKELDRKNIMLIEIRDDYLKETKFLEDINDEIKLKEKNIQEKKDSIIKVYNLISDKKNKINSLDTFRQNIRNRLTELEKEIDILKNEKMEKISLVDSLHIELESIKRSLNACKNKKKEDLENKKKIESEYNILLKEIDEKRGLLQGKTSNYNLLKNMEEDYEGYYKSVRNLLLGSKKDLKLNSGIVGVVGELIKVDEKYEKAIEITLGSSIQNVLTNTEEDAKKAIQYLKKNKLGRVTFLPLTSIKGRKLNINIKEIENDGAIGIASQLVEFDERYRNVFEYLLGRTLIVEDIDSAMKIARKYKHSVRIVTLAGELFNPGGSITGGSTSKSSTNILNRKTRIDELIKEMKGLKEELELYKKKKDKLDISLNNLEKIIEEGDKKVQSLNIEIIKIENEITKLTQYNEKNDAYILKYSDEINKLEEEEKDINLQVNNLNLELISLNKDKDLIDKTISEGMEKFQSEKDIKEEVDRKVTDFKIQINSLEKSISFLKNGIENIDKNYENVLNNITNREKDNEKNLIKMEGLKNIKEKIKRETGNLNLLLSNCSTKLEELKKEKEKSMGSFILEEKKLKEIEKNINIFGKKVNSLDISYTKYSVKIESNMSRLLEDYEMGYEEALSYKMDIIYMDEVQKEIKKLKNDIKNLGTVNLGAVEEYKKLKERLDFIQAQKKDLLSAKDGLKKVIKDIEKEMEQRFMKNFNVIKQNFNQVFRELFGGGKADVYLIDEENSLSSGIEIMAQPPGKKLQSLSLLSGGEKSLTAVALLFAILKTKPTPFCILDEIDAALDEANISRYTNYLKSFSDKTQFIMITHRKGSMEMADILYGVTMEEEGISRIVSIKLSDKDSEKVS